jgi:anti-repressor protein
MTALVPIEQREVGGELIQTVDARELWEFLDVAKDFSTWLKDRIQQYGFVEGRDFSPILGKTSGGRPTKEYALSLDMAKELSMVERNARGKQARLGPREGHRINPTDTGWARVVDQAVEA